MIYLKPVLPVTAAKAEEFLNVEPLVWQDLDSAFMDRPISKFKPLMQRVDEKKVTAMVDASKSGETGVKQVSPEIPGADETNTYITIDDFQKIDLRVGRIVEANHVEGADKLLQLTVDIGDARRNVFAGIKAAYSADSLLGKHVIVVANLQPRKMRFGVSEGMVLAAGPGEENIFLLSPDSGADAGMKVK